MGGPQDHLHVTMRFLGEVSEASIPGVEQVSPGLRARRRPARSRGPARSGLSAAASRGSSRRLFADDRAQQQTSSRRVRRLVDEGRAGSDSAGPRDFNAHVDPGRASRGEEDRRRGTSSGRARPRLRALPGGRARAFRAASASGGSVYTPLLAWAGPCPRRGSDAWRSLGRCGRTSIGVVDLELAADARSFALPQFPSRSSTRGGSAPERSHGRRVGVLPGRGNPAVRPPDVSRLDLHRRSLAPLVG